MSSGCSGVENKVLLILTNNICMRIKHTFNIVETAVYGSV